MSSRKANVSPVVNSARPIKTTATISAEYIDAIHLLNESTLNNACEILLDDTNSDDEKLLELYYKCEDALKVIQKQQPTVPSSPMLPPGAPNLNAPRTTAPPQRSLPKLNKKTLSMAASSKGVIPMRRTALNKPSLSKLPSKPQPKARERERSEGDVPFPENKKARLSPPLPGGATAPPPNALNFLAKLNKDPKGEAAKRKNPGRAMNRRSAA